MNVNTEMTTFLGGEVLIDDEHTMKFCWMFVKSERILKRQDEKNE